MDVLEIWNVSVSTDIEGKTTKIAARFWDEAQAIIYSSSAACTKQDSWGKNGRAWKSLMTVFNTSDEANDFSKEEVKRKALEKLTPLEKELLGLK